MMYKKLSITALTCLAIWGSSLAMQNSAAPVAGPDVPGQARLTQAGPAGQQHQEQPFPKLSQFCTQQEASRLCSDDMLDAFMNRESGHWQEIDQTAPDRVISLVINQLNTMRPGVLRGFAVQNRLRPAGNASQALFSPTENRLATVTGTRIDIWRLQETHNAQEHLAANTWHPEQCLQGHTGTINTIKFNTTGDRLVTASDDHTAIVWHFDGTRWILEQVLTGHKNRVNAAVFNSPDENRIATTSDDNTAYIWVLRDDGQWTLEVTIEARTNNSDTGGIVSPGFGSFESEDGTIYDNFIMVSDNVCKVYRYSNDQWQLVQELNEDDYDGVVGARFNNDGNYIIVDVAAGIHLAIWSLQDNDEWLRVNELNRLEDLMGDLTPEEEEALDDTITTFLAVSAHNQIVTDGENGEPLVWKLLGSLNTAQSLNGLAGCIKSASFNNTGNRLVATSDKTLCVWILRNGEWKITDTFTMEHTIRSASWNADGTYIVVTFFDAPPLILRSNMLLIDTNITQVMLLLLAQREFRRHTPLNLNAHPNLVPVWNQLTHNTKNRLCRRYRVVKPQEHTQNTGQASTSHKRSR